MMVVMPIATQAVVNLAILPDGIQLAILRHDLQIAIHRGDADPAAFLKKPVIYGLRCGESIVSCSCFTISIRARVTLCIVGIQRFPSSPKAYRSRIVMPLTICNDIRYHKL
jgi:hypothetical protein